MNNDIKFLQKFNSKYNFLDSIGIKLLTQTELFTLEGYIKPEESSYFKNGIFKFKIDFHPNYPIQRPILRIVNRIFHMNVSNDGFVCVKYIQQWKKTHNIIGILSNLYQIFLWFNPHNPFDTTQAHLFLKNREEFKIKCEEWTNKFALKHFPKEDYSFFELKDKIKSSKCIIVDIKYCRYLFLDLNKKMTLKEIFSYEDVIDLIPFKNKKYVIIADKKKYFYPFNDDNYQKEEPKFYSIIFILPKAIF